MNLQMSFTDLKINIKKDFNERTIFLQATTRGDNKIKKEMLVGIKKACKFNVPHLTYEFVFDHGYAGDTYGVNDIINVYGATTSNFAEGSSHQDWTGSCNIDSIIYERTSDSVAGVNKTETSKYQSLFETTEQFEKQNGKCRQLDDSFESQDVYNPIGQGTLKDHRVCA
jgi:hypothetical protein